MVNKRYKLSQLFAFFSLKWRPWTKKGSQIQTRAAKKVPRRAHISWRGPIWEQCNVKPFWVSLCNSAACFPDTPDNSHHRHHRRWCTFFKPAYLFPQRTRNGLLLGKFIQRIKTFFCDENRCTIPNSKCNKYNIPMPQTPITPTNM